jgi:hypothetical protein
MFLISIGGVYFRMNSVFGGHAFLDVIPFYHMHIYICTAATDLRVHSGILDTNLGMMSYQNDVMFLFSFFCTMTK